MSSTGTRRTSLFHVALLLGIICCFGLAALSDSSMSAIAEDAPPSQDVSISANANTEDAENAAEAQTIPDEEHSLTQLQKAIDAARESETPEEAVHGTRKILDLLAEQHSKQRGIGANLQSEMRRATIEAQDIASNAAEGEETWKHAYKEKLQTVQEQLDKAVQHEQEAQQFAAVVLVCIVGLFFLFFICLVVPELGCLIILLVFLAAIAGMILL